MSHELASLVENLGALVCAVDGDLNLLWSNAILGEWLGLDTSRWIGKPINELAGVERWEEYRPYFEKALSEGSAKFDLNNPPGVWPNAPRWTRVWLRVAKDDDGSPLEMLILSTDITPAAHKRVLQEKSILFDDSPVAKFLLSSDGRLMTRNAAAVELLGADETLEVGSRLSIFSGPDRSGFERLLELCANGSRFEAAQLTGRLRDGSALHLRVRANAFFNITGEVDFFLVTLLDETERVRLERQFLQAQKMEAIGQLAGGIAHDFNNLLGLIIGQLDLMRLRIDPGDELNGMVDSMLSVAQSGAELNKQMLAFARQQVLEPVAIMADELLAGMAKLLVRTMGEKMEVRVINDSKLWPVMADRAQFESAIVNLCVNSRDAMPSGGRLTIETRNVTILPEDRLAYDLEPGDYVVIALTDTGVGMTPEVKSRAFDPFFTTKPVGVGSGLGLSMVFGFIKQSRGHVQVYSEVGLGTTIRMYLPRALSDTPIIEKRLDLSPSVRSSELWVLIVEDNARLRAVVSQQVSALGYPVIEAGNAEEALSALNARPAPDILFTDIVMPGAIDGVELAHRARVVRPDIGILLTSGFAGRDGSPIAAAEIAFDILPKPYRLAELETALARAAAR